MRVPYGPNKEFFKYSLFLVFCNRISTSAVSAGILLVMVLKLTWLVCVNGNCLRVFISTLGAHIDGLWFDSFKKIWSDSEFHLASYNKVFQNIMACENCKLFWPKIGTWRILDLLFLRSFYSPLSFSFSREVKRSLTLLLHFTSIVLYRCLIYLLRLVSMR